MPRWNRACATSLRGFLLAIFCTRVEMLLTTTAGAMEVDGNEALVDDDEGGEEEALEPIPFLPAAPVANLTLHDALRLVHDEVVAQDTADAKVFLAAVDEAYAPVCCAFNRHHSPQPLGSLGVQRDYQAAHRPEHHWRQGCAKAVYLRLGVHCA